MDDLVWASNGLRYFRFPRLSSYRELSHAVYTRHGGISQRPFDSLNVSYTVGDRAENVRENLERIRRSMGASTILFMNQEHGKGVAVFKRDAGRMPSDAPLADALVTNIPQVGLLVKQADCQGIILYDPEQGVVANVHCGWRGNVNNILGRVVSSMVRDFGSKETNILAAIGPSSGPCCAQFVTYKSLFPKDFKAFMVGENYFDLWAISCWQLMGAGIKEDNIEVSGICTRCRTDLFYSYRAERRTGRFATAAMLR